MMTPADAEVVAEAKRLHRAGAITQAECDEVVAAAHRRYREPITRTAATPATATTSPHPAESIRGRSVVNSSMSKGSAVNVNSGGRRAFSEPRAFHEEAKTKPYPSSSKSPALSSRASRFDVRRGGSASGNGGNGDKSHTGLNIPEPPQTARTVIASRGGLGGYQEWDTRCQAGSSHLRGRPSSMSSHHLGKNSTLSTASKSTPGAARQRISFESVKDDESLFSSGDDDDDDENHNGNGNGSGGGNDRDTCNSLNRSVYKTPRRSIVNDNPTTAATTAQSSVSSKRLPLAWTPTSPSSRRAAAASAASATASATASTSKAGSSSNGVYSDTRALLNEASPAANATATSPATTSRSLSHSPSQSRSQGRSTVNSAAKVATSTAAATSRQAAEEAAAYAAHQLSMGMGMSTSSSDAATVARNRGRGRRRGVLSASADSFISAWAPPPLGDPTWRRHHHHRSLSPKGGRLMRDSTSGSTGTNAFEAPPSGPQLWPPLPAVGARGNTGARASTTDKIGESGGGVAGALVYEVTLPQAIAARGWLMGLGFAVAAPELNGDNSSSSSSSSNFGNDIRSSSDNGVGNSSSGVGESANLAAVRSPLLDPLRNGLLLGDLLEVLEPHAANHARLGQVLWRPPKVLLVEHKFLYMLSLS